MEKLRSLKRIVDISEPILAEESTHGLLPLSLIAVLEQLDKKATYHEYFIALILVLLAESGFRILSKKADLIDANESSELKKQYFYSSCSKYTDNVALSSVCNISECQNTRLVYIPWRSPKQDIYDIYIELNKSRNIQLKLVAIPFGTQKIILNIFPCTRKNKIYSMVVPILQYIKIIPNTRNPYMNLGEISHRFKDEIATPLRTYILSTVGLMGPSLEGLPVELKIKIIKMLNLNESIQLQKSVFGIQLMEFDS